MPAVRIERVPVQSFGLGVLGFDHLQLVFEPAGSSLQSQDSWHVIEGLREPDDAGVRLAVEGWHGGTTLAEANGGAFGVDLIAKIGTPVERGSCEIAAGAEAIETWASFVSYATEIELERFPYTAYSLPGSPGPIVNSSSLVASLLFHAGIDVASALPLGLRLSPGLGTLLGTSGDDAIDLSGSGFTTVLGGAGRDIISGSVETNRVDKLFGGRGDDLLRWSAGFNVLHGGQPGVTYAEDGEDTVDYAGVGNVRIEAAPSPVEHQRPDYIATFNRGVDHLFSIEELIWDDASDSVVLGKGIGILREPLKVSVGGGDDFVDGGEAEFATFVDAGEGADVVIAGPAPTILRSGPGADLFVLATAGGEHVLLDADQDDRLLVPWEFAEANAEAGPEGDLLICIRDHAAGSATVRVRNFESGDLGLIHDGRGLIELEPDRTRVLVVPALIEQIPEYDSELPVGVSFDDLRHG